MAAAIATLKRTLRLRRSSAEPSVTRNTPLSRYARKRLAAIDAPRFKADPSRVFQRT